MTCCLVVISIEDHSNALHPPRIEVVNIEGENGVHFCGDNRLCFLLAPFKVSLFCDLRRRRCEFLHGFNQVYTHIKN
jgi:hypothetical protein